MTQPDSAATLAQRLRERTKKVEGLRFYTAEDAALDRSATEAMECAHDDNIALQRIFDLQHRRMAEATAEWRKLHPGNDLVQPDLGALLTWMLACMNKSGTTIEALQDMVTEAEQQVDTLSKQLAEADEVIKQMADKAAKNAGGAILYRADGPLGQALARHASRAGQKEEERTNEG